MILDELREGQVSKKTEYHFQKMKLESLMVAK